MFGAANLKQNPFISNEFDHYQDFVAPPIEDTSCSDYLYLAIQNDAVEKIYAMRVLPFHDILAFKIQYKDADGPESEIIMRPELCLIKRIWDCGNPAFNSGLRHYIQHSKHCVHQYSNKTKFLNNSASINEWFYKVFLNHV